MANPSVRNGHIDIANELAEEFARLNLKGEDWRILWVVLRQTWGWKQDDRKKDFDTISLSQFEKKTGMKRANVARVLKRLVAYKLLLKRENGYGINQNHDEWIVAHRLPSSVACTKAVAHELPKPVAYKLPTIDKKDILTKDMAKSETKTNELNEGEWKQTVIDNEWCDAAYADKTWTQSLSLTRPDREEFRRKSRVMINAAGHARTRGMAKVVFHEIAGLVNDRGAMQSKLTPQEIESRRLFKEDTGEDL